jgi:hypothetical protein
MLPCVRNSVTALSGLLFVEPWSCQLLNPGFVCELGFNDSTELLRHSRRPTACVFLSLFCWRGLFCGSYLYNLFAKHLQAIGQAQLSMSALFYLQAVLSSEQRCMSEPLLHRCHDVLILALTLVAVLHHMCLFFLVACVQGG